MITTLLYSNEIRASPDTPAHVRVDIVNTGSTVHNPVDVIGLPEGWVAPIGPIPELPPNQSWRGNISFTVPSRHRTDATSPWSVSLTPRPVSRIAPTASP